MGQTGSHSAAAMLDGADLDTVGKVVEMRHAGPDRVVEAAHFVQAVAAVYDRQVGELAAVASILIVRLADESIFVGAAAAAPAAAAAVVAAAVVVAAAAVVAAGVPNDLRVHRA
jgi:hypothetical protein